LKIENGIVAFVFECTTKCIDFVERFAGERISAPLFGRCDVDAIDERLHGTSVAGIASITLLCRQQSAPRWFNHPFNHPRGVRDPQCGHGRKRMENVTHGAETDHEQAKLGLGLQILIFSQGQ
jgi:hypothetical protein